MTAPSPTPTPAPFSSSLSAPPVVVAVDGGGSKTEAVALDLHGNLRGRALGPGSSPHLETLTRSASLVDTLVMQVAGTAPIAGVDLYLSGLDLPREITEYLSEIQRFPWSSTATVDNDLFALLSSGTRALDAVAVVCGTGINAVGRRRDGQIARFVALGQISGDWGGGYGLGAEALWHAARDADGRGPSTALSGLICQQLDVPSIADLIEQLHLGRRPHSDLAHLAPTVFDAADLGDRISRDLVGRQADEVVALFNAAAHRLDITGGPVDVVLGGAILRAGHHDLDDRISRGVLATAPKARILRPTAGPVLGAALLALRRAGAHQSALDRAHEQLSRPDDHVSGQAAPRPGVLPVQAAPELDKMSHRTPMDSSW